jgi:transposase
VTEYNGGDDREAARRWSVRKLDAVIKISVLKAVIGCDFDMIAAAKKLGIGRPTIYRWFKRWKLPTPAGRNRSTENDKSGVERRERIRMALDQAER